MRKIIIITIKWLSFLAVFGYAGWLVMQDDNILEAPGKFAEKLHEGKNIAILVFVLLLTPVNWGIEALKWKVAAHRLVPLTFKKAFISVLRGLALGFITPRSVGDYLGRVIDIPAEKRLEAVGGLAFVRISSFFWTAVFGVAGFWVFYSADVLSKFSLDTMIIGALVCLALITTGLLLRHIIVRWLEKRIKKQIVQLVRILRFYSNKVMAKVMWLSFLRYLTFSGQFMLLLLVGSGGADIWLMFFGISATYLAKSLVVSFNFLTDIGIREVAALTFLPLAGLEAGTIVMSSLMLWMINVLLPTLVGALFLLTANLRTWKLPSSPSR